MIRRTTGLALGGLLSLSSLELSNEGLTSSATQPVPTRYGRSFRSEDIKAYFGAQPWYKANPTYSDSIVNPSEKSCVD